MSIYDEELPPQGGLYLKIEPETTVRLRLTGDPVRFEKAFPGDQPTVRFGAFAIVKTVGADKAIKREMRAWEFGPSVFRVIRTLYRNDDYGDPVNYDISVSRKGTGKNTEYTVVPHPPQPMKDEDCRLISEWTHTLDEVFRKGQPNEEPDYFADD